MSQEAARQLAKKLKLEKRFKPKIKKIFNAMARDIKAVYKATGRVANIADYETDVVAMLRSHYRDVSKEFSSTLRSKCNHLVLETKQEESIDALMGEYITKHSVTQAAYIMATTQDDLNKSVVKAILENNAREVPQSRDVVASDVEAYFNQSTNGRIDTIAITETQTPAEQMKLIEAGIISGVVASQGQQIYKTWNTVLDEKTRASHVEADRQRVPENQPFQVQGQLLMVPGDTSLGASLSNIINCLHPDSVVQVCDPKALTRRLYQGCMVTIQTSNGSNITVTPNHPILTVVGWKPARLINESDYIVTASRAELMSLCDFDVDNVNASIEQIFNSINVEAITMGVGTGNMNFHGDISNSDVDIIASHSLLRDAFKSFGCHIGNKIRFKGSNFIKRFLLVKCLSGKPFVSSRLISSSFICRAHKLLSIFFACLLHSKEHRITSASCSNSSLFKAIYDNTSRNSKNTSDPLNGKIVIEMLSDNRNLFASSKVIKTHTFNYDGYVYNLEDSKQYYICNGIVNHNCRCSAVYNPEGVESSPLDIPRQLLR